MQNYYFLRIIFSVLSFGLTITKDTLFSPFKLIGEKFDLGCCFQSMYSTFLNFEKEALFHCHLVYFLLPTLTYNIYKFKSQDLLQLFKSSSFTIIFPLLVLFLEWIWQIKRPRFVVSFMRSMVASPPSNKLYKQYDRSGLTIQQALNIVLL